MFDLDSPLGAAPVASWTSALAEAPLASEPADPAALVEEIRALEELACAAQARQARLTAAFDVAEQARQAAAGTRASERGRGIGEQIALARRESPHRGRQHLSLARILPELPHTAEAFRRGLVTEWRVVVMARETACLDREARTTIDRALAADPDAFASYSDRTVLAEIRKLTARLDPAAVAERRRRAEAERRVTLRPAPDTMAYLTVLLPVAQAVATYATLVRDADTDRAAGDPRSRGQVMADTLVTRVTGAPAAGNGRPVVPVAVGLVMTDRAAFAGAHDDAALDGHGPIPADLARELLAGAVDQPTKTWVHRLYRHPQTHELLAMDSRRRCFPRRLATFLRHRDQWCRQPWCGAPIRHSDHATPAADGGTTDTDDGQGLCEACNYAKEADGWRHRPRPGPDGHTIEITTPTGRRYESRPPPLLGPRPDQPAYHQTRPGHWERIA